MAGGTVLVANSTLLAILVAFIWYRIRRTSTGLLDLGALFALHLALNYPFRVIALSLLGERVAPSYRDLLADDSLERVTAVSALGIVAFVASYAFLSRGQAPRRVMETPPLTQRHFSLLALVYALAVVAKVVKILSGNYISYLIGDELDLRWANPIENLHMLGWFALAAVWFALFSGQLNTPGRIFFFATVNCVELGYQLIQGSKTYLMLPVFVVGLAYYAARRRIPYALAAGGVLWFGLVVFPYVDAYRQVVDQGIGHVPRFAEFSPGETVRDAAGEAGRTHIGVVDALLRALGRFAGADELHNLMAMVPAEMPYRVGRDFLVVLVTPIPRAIWPSKPVFSLGAEYGEQLGSITAVTPFPIGEAFWNGGLLGVAVGMAVWAAFLVLMGRLFTRLCHRREWAAVVTSVFLAEAYWLTTGEATLAMTIASTMKRGLVYASVFILADAVLKRRAGQAHRPRSWERGSRSTLSALRVHGTGTSPLRR